MLVYLAVVLTIMVVSMMLLAAFKHSKVRRQMAPVPGPRSLPIIGTTCLINSSGAVGVDQLEALCKVYPESGIFKIWYGSHPAIFIYKADAVETLCANSKHIQKSYLYTFFEPWLGKGLLTSTGDKWKSRRRMLTPAFHFKILEEFVEVFNEQAARLVEIMDKLVDNSEGFDVQPLLSRCTLDIICETAMGYHVDAQNKVDSEYFDAICKLANAVIYRRQSSWLWPDVIFNMSSTGRQHNKALNVLHSFTRQVIEDRCAELLAKQESQSNDEPSDNESSANESSANESSPNESSTTQSSRRRMHRSDSIIDVIPARKRLAFLDMLLDVAKDDKQITQSNIQEEVDTFMFAGHDTTSAATMWLMYTVGSHPDVQRRLHEEVDALMGESWRQLTLQDMSQLKYMECVIKETMRLYPSVTMFARETSDECTIGGYTVPKGTTVAVLTRPLHRDPDQFPDPEKFDPDRWTNQNGRHPYSYVPFSAGPRNCIGQKFAMLEVKMVLCYILSRFEVTCLDTVVTPISQLVLRSKDGLRIKLKRRNC